MGWNALWCWRTDVAFLAFALLSFIIFPCVILVGLLCLFFVDYKGEALFCPIWYRCREEKGWSREKFSSFFPLFVWECLVKKQTIGSREEKWRWWAFPQFECSGWVFRVGEMGSGKQKSPKRRCLTLDDSLQCIFSCLDSYQDRAAVSLVCKQWYRVDGATRKQIYIPNCYSILPSGLSKRFKDLQSIKLKGKPRASEFDILEKDWGGHTGPWVQEIVRSYPKLQALHLRRMEICDEDLELLARGCTSLQVFHFLSCNPHTPIHIQTAVTSINAVIVVWERSWSFSPSKLSHSETKSISTGTQYVALH
jgi:hypothetical protein